MGEPAASEATYSCADGVLKQEHLNIMVAAWIFLHLFCLLASHWSYKGDHCLRFSCTELSESQDVWVFSKSPEVVFLWNHRTGIIFFSVKDSRSWSEVILLHYWWSRIVLYWSILWQLALTWYLQHIASFQRAGKHLCSGQHMKWARGCESFIPTPWLDIGWLSWVWSFNTTHTHTTGRRLFLYKLRPTETQYEFCFRNCIAFSD